MTAATRTTTPNLSPATATLLLVETGGSLDETAFAATVKAFGGVPYGGAEAEAARGIFTRASDAVGCALELALSHDVPAPDASLHRPRITLHTGELPLDEDGGEPHDLLKRCGLIAALGHPGQILMSRSTVDLVGDRLPPDAEVRDLGPHRLKDLVTKSDVYQLCHPKLPDDFPTLHSLDALPNNLPLQLTSFVGRDTELSHVRELLEKTRLVTLTGPGGCGKTRLAQHVAVEVLDRFPEGVWFVDFAPIIDPALVPSAIGSALGIREAPAQPLEQTLETQLRDAQMLLLLDNCEHVVEQVAPLTDSLLRSCPSISILGTSREQLGIEGEVPWRVPPLSLPDIPELPETEAAAPDAPLLVYDAPRLFVERALKVAPTLQLSEENRSAILEICQRVEGIPLAIELAAARASALAVPEIAEGLRNRFDLLSGRSRSTVERQQTLEASVAWSFNLLSEPEQVLLRRLGSFWGGFTIQAVRDVCEPDESQRDDVVNLLASLVDKSLVQVDELGPRSRYRLLEAVRHYALDRLIESGEEVEIRTRHRDFLVALAEAGEPELTGPNQDEWCARLESEHDNLRAALEFSKQQGAHDALLRLAGALVFFWGMRGHFREARAWLAEALSQGDSAAPDARVKALWGQGYIGLVISDMVTVKPYAEESLAIYRQLDHKQGIARSLCLLGWSTVFGGDPKARALLEESAELAREAGDMWCLAAALERLGYMFIGNSDIREANRCLQESIAVARGIGDGFRIRGSSVYLGWVKLFQGEFAEARDLLREVVENAKRVQDRHLRSLGLGFLGYALMHLGDYDGARVACQESLAMGRESGNVLIEARALFVLGKTAQAEGDHAAARELLEQSVALVRAVPMPFFRATYLAALGDAEATGGDIDAARKHLDEATKISREASNRWGLARALSSLAALDAQADQDDRAENLWHEALALFLKMGDKAGTADGLRNLTQIAAKQGSYVEATRLAAAASAISDSIGYVLPAAQRERFEATTDILRKQLSGGDFGNAWAEGQELGIADAVAYASRGRGERKRPASGWNSLTPAELSVVRLLPEGLSNVEIGERLFISAGTVKVHLSHVYAKLGLSKRTEVAAEAVRRNLKEHATESS